MTRIRVLIFDPAHAENPANVWVDSAAQDGAFLFRLLQDYPDFKPTIGFHVQAAGKIYEVVTVALPELSCQELPGHTHAEGSNP